MCESVNVYISINFHGVGISVVYMILETVAELLASIWMSVHIKTSLEVKNELGVLGNVLLEIKIWIKRLTPLL